MSTSDWNQLKSVLKLHSRKLLGIGSLIISSILILIVYNNCDDSSGGKKSSDKTPSDTTSIQGTVYGYQSYAQSSKPVSLIKHFKSTNREVIVNSTSNNQGVYTFSSQDLNFDNVDIDYYIIDTDTRDAVTGHLHTMITRDVMVKNQINLAHSTYLTEIAYQLFMVCGRESCVERELSDGSGSDRIKYANRLVSSKLIAENKNILPQVGPADPKTFNNVDANEHYITIYLISAFGYGAVKNDFVTGFKNDEFKEEIAVGLATQYATYLSSLAPTFAAVATRIQDDRDYFINDMDLDSEDDTSGEYVNAAYYTDYDRYGRNYPVEQIPVEKLTHVIYAFFPICGSSEISAANAIDINAAATSGGKWKLSYPSNCRDKQIGEMVIADYWSAFEVEGSTYREDLSATTATSGNYKKLNELKSRNPGIKIVASIGGYTWSNNFIQIAANETYLRNFTNSVYTFLKGKGDIFDGIDIDWEWPGKADIPRPAGLLAANDNYYYANFITKIRDQLDILEREESSQLLLTTAVMTTRDHIDLISPIGGTNYYQQIIDKLDMIFLMSYDFYGAWEVGANNPVGHHTGLNANPAGRYSGAAAMDYLKGKVGDANKHKLVLGYAAYGRGFKDVTVTGSPTVTAANSINGKGALCDYRPEINVDGTYVKPGIYENCLPEYRYIKNYILSEAGATYNWDSVAQAPFVWIPSTKTFITYDNIDSVKAKANYVKANHYGGVFTWALSGDSREVGGGDLLKAADEVFNP